MSSHPSPFRFRVDKVLAVLLLGACSDYNINNKEHLNGGAEDDPEDTGELGEDSGDPPVDEVCEPTDFPAEERGIDDTCGAEPPGGFTPITEWSHGSGQGCLSQPIVADVDQDGMPEVIFNRLPNFLSPPGHLVVLRGDTGALVWEDTDANIAYGSPPAVADIDGDGDANIVVVREYASALTGPGDYTVAAYDSAGNELWESDHFEGLDFDWATAPNIRDMDKDGFPEVIAGRVILNGADGSTRGVGAFGRGSYGITSVFGFTVSESSVPAVVDIDLDGVDEVIVGNAMYSPDGAPLWFDTSYDDAMISVANFDADPEGEFIGISYNTIRLMDTDGSIIWGPTEVPGANILSVAGIADLDQDGTPEVVTAGGNNIVVFHGDGSVFWQAPVTDESGATGASFFDFEGDGVLDVVYIDELNMTVYDGITGAVKFIDGDHGSNTMMDYPTVADVDADGEAEIIVCHNSFGAAVSVYGDLNHTWRGARPLWNQHAYSITNINDDLSVPTSGDPGFVVHNTWHSAIPADLGVVGLDLAAEVIEVCTDDCDEGTVRVTGRMVNVGPDPLEDSISVTLYAELDGVWTAVHTETFSGGLDGGWTTDGIEFVLDASVLEGATGVMFAVDDDGTGEGIFSECSETNNTEAWRGDLCASE